MSYRRAPANYPKPELTHAERVARLEALIAHIGREMDAIIPGEWEVTFEFPAAKRNAEPENGP